MNEEISRQTISVSFQVARLTAPVLQKAFHQLLADQARQKSNLHKGKQTMKQLMKHNSAISNIEVTYDNIKAFEHTAKKYGIDFAIKKDSSMQPPRYLVFFKGKDADVLTAAFKEFSAKQLSKDKKPSLRKLLKIVKAKMQQTTLPKKKKREMEL